MFPLWILAATAVIFATATVVAEGAVTTTAAAEEDEDKNDYPRTVITTKVTHLRKPPFLFSSHTMLRLIKMLHNKNKKVFDFS